MSKYINYDAIDYRNDRLHDKSEEFLNGVIYMAQRIEEAPSIDIVICEECLWQDDCSRMVKSLDGLVSTALTWCSDGERKDDE